MGWQMVPKLYSLVIAFVTNLTGIYKFLFMFIFDMKLQTKSTFKYFPQVPSFNNPANFAIKIVTFCFPS
jgi:hypothetical protein